ncbi:cytochrome P450 monooxygenase pc-3 [Dichomitus squalens LYAD-421 SS1]|uniref:cytochrome P450 monooxygenase pc-3 n=1 Tax=Dichomitus squalens (strain LYAD-421) TaxID=732165 RepID=UPI0004412388|nr:cytochrome P450 monooxygenase pc-3 [Dichomitus squalens LYAD-421 SS1]EJF62806.1 cytochrome P450 monooxygenase pc-3 [Dichomitus squalens LYAD-421 SS1]
MSRKPSLPPGVPFLFKLLLVVSAPPFAVYALARVATSQDVVLPTWAWILAEILSGPLALTARVWWKYSSFRRGAERLGAVMPPEMVGHWIGNLDLLTRILDAFENGYPSDMFDVGFGECGPILRFSLFWDMQYSTKDPNIVKTVLATDFNNYEKGEMFHDFTDSLFGTGVFNADGDMWKFHRSMSRPFFSRERISDFDLFDRHADVALGKIRERVQANIAFDFQELIARFTLDSATEFLFGNCVHSLHSPMPYPKGMSPYNIVDEPKSIKEKFPHAFAMAQRIVSERPRVGWLWPLKELFKSRTDEHMAIVDAFLEPLLQEAIRKKEEREKAGASLDDKESQDDETLLDNLVKQTSDYKILHDETLNILLAGRDTTAAALTFGVYLLCQHPHVLKRLREEIVEHVGYQRRPTYDDVRNMKYLRAFLNETLRLYPSVPFDIRFSIKEGTLPNPDPTGKPIYIPPKTAISYSIFNMHRDPVYWGPTAQEFDPDRFLDERVGKYLVPNPFIFLPFNAGPRICLGQQFAYNEMSFFMIRLLQNFSSMELDLTAQPQDSRPPPEWATEGEGRKAKEQIAPKSHFTLYANGGCWVKMGVAEA